MHFRVDVPQVVYGINGYAWFAVHPQRVVLPMGMDEPVGITLPTGGIPRDDFSPVIDTQSGCIAGAEEVDCDILSARENNLSCAG
jgi:hypothetical protein